MKLTPAYPPFRMKAKDASHYAGMSLSSFLRAVDIGEMPRSRERFGGRYWLRAELEAAMLDDAQMSHDFSQKI